MSSALDSAISSFSNYSAPIALSPESLLRAGESMKAFNAFPDRMVLALSKLQEKMMIDLFASDREFTISEEG